MLLLLVGWFIIIKAIATQTCGFNLMSLREIVTADRETTTNYGLSGQMVE